MFRTQCTNLFVCNFTTVTVGSKITHIITVILQNFFLQEIRGGNSIRLDFSTNNIEDLLLRGRVSAQIYISL